MNNISDDFRDLKKVNKSGQGCLHYAAFSGDTQVVELLITAGLDPNNPDEFGMTPLHYAAQGGHAETVELLLINGADAARLTDDGRSAAQIAEQCGHIDLGQSLRNLAHCPNTTSQKVSLVSPVS